MGASWNSTESLPVNSANWTTGGSHFYLALYWATELAKQNEDLDLKNKFEPFAKYLSDNEQKIVAELASAQGHAVDIGGYYLPDAEKLAKIMRPNFAFIYYI